MKQQSPKLIHFTIIICLLLMLVPWQGWMAKLQPYWLALGLIYWSIEKPQQCGLFTAFFYSILLDILFGSLLGKHGFSILIMIFLISNIHKRLRMTSFWQLSLLIGALLLNDALLRLLVDWLSTQEGTLSINFWSILTSVLIWPWFKYFMDRLRYNR